MINNLIKAKDLALTEPDKALKLANEVLDLEFDSELGQMALFIAGYIMLEADRPGIAYHIFKRCIELNPNQAEIYINLGMCTENDRPDESIKAFRKARELDPGNPNSYANESLIWLDKGKPEKCIKLADKALSINPELRPAYHNKGLALLSLKKFKEGWKIYSDTLGVKFRAKMNYGVPDWDYRSKGKILVYGEQGVGDEIMFASMLEDLSKDHDIVLDTDKRLKTLFDRSFEFPVYGTRFDDESPIRSEHNIDYQVAIGQLGHLYRNKESDFPGKPYLKTDPENDFKWLEEFDKFKGKKIGLAWSGGLKNTGQHRRTLNIEDLKPILDKDNTYISLEYKDVDPNILNKYGIKSYPQTRKGEDIDDLASLIGQLDYVITACTTVVYISGALGIPCYVLTPSEPSYRYHSKGAFPWYKSVDLIRQKPGEKWAKTVTRLKSILKNEH